ncbi:MAG TPA: hypothetical protein VIV60_24295 [Polyangiaceae bacterium]
MNKLVALSYAGADTGHAQILRGFLRRHLSDEQIFTYVANPLPNANVPKRLKELFESATVVVLLVGSQYQHNSNLCNWEAQVATNRIAAAADAGEEDSMVHVAAIGGIEVGGALGVALCEHGSLTVPLSVHAASPVAFSELRGLARKVTMSLESHGCLPRFPRAVTGNGDHCVVRRHLEGLHDRMEQERESTELSQMAQEGVRTSAVLLARLQQLRRAAAVQRALRHLGALADSEHGGVGVGPSGNHFAQLHLSAFALLKLLERHGETALCSADVYERLYQRCILLLRLEDYLARHFGSSKIALSTLIEHLSCIVLPERVADAVVGWTDRLPMLSKLCEMTARCFPEEFWMADEEDWQVEKPADLDELTAFRKARQGVVQRLAEAK